MHLISKEVLKSHSISDRCFHFLGRWSYMIDAVKSKEYDLLLSGSSQTLSRYVHISRYLCICHIWVFPHRKYQRLSGCRLHFGLLAFWDIFFSQSTKITLVHFLQFLYSGHQFQELKKSSIYLKRFPYLLKGDLLRSTLRLQKMELFTISKNGKIQLVIFYIT